MPSNIFQLASAPHEWVFPRVKAVVHHGGAGTTAASLRAGVPSIIIPHLADQTFWGKRVEMLGVGTKPIPREKLTISALARAIQFASSNPRLKQRAAELAVKIRAEDGVANALNLMQHFLVWALLDYL